jgi:hypothetical protein
MKNELDRKKLYDEAFALIKRIKTLLLEARTQHEKDAAALKAAA